MFKIPGCNPIAKKRSYDIMIPMFVDVKSQKPSIVQRGIGALSFREMWEFCYLNEKIAGSLSYSIFLEGVPEEVRCHEFGLL